MPSTIWLVVGLFVLLALAVATRTMIRFARARSQYKKYGEPLPPGHAHADSSQSAEEPSDLPPDYPSYHGRRPSGYGNAGSTWENDLKRPR